MAVFPTQDVAKDTTLQSVRDRLDTIHTDDTNSLAKLEAIRALLAAGPSGGTSDAATETTLAAIEALLNTGIDVTVSNPTAPTDLTGTNSKLDTLHTDETTSLAKLEAIRALLAGTVNVNVANPTANTDLTGTNARLDTLHTDETTVATILNAIESNQVNQAVNATLVGGADITDRAPRLLGHVTVDNGSLTVNTGLDLSGLATQTTLAAVNTKLGGTLTADITDRPARLLGHTNVDNFPTSFNIGNFPATQAVTQSGLWTVATGLDLSPLATQSTLASLLAQFPSAATLTGTAGTVGGVAAVGWDSTNSVWRRIAVNSQGATQIAAMGSYMTTPADAVTNANMAGPATPAGNFIFGGTNWDRMRAAEAAQGTAGTGLLGVGGLAYDTTNSIWRRLWAATTGALMVQIGGLTSPSDTLANNSGQPVVGYNELWNGTSWDRLRSIAAADNTTGTGVLASAAMLWDGTNYRRWVTANGVADAASLATSASVGGWIFNGTTWDRQRSAAIGDAIGTITGIPGMIPYVYNGASWDRARSAPGSSTGTRSMAGDSLVVTGTGAALNATPIAATDARAYRWVSVQLVGDASISNVIATFEVSNDNTNWNTGALSNAGATQVASQQTVAVSASASVTLHGPITARYFRVKLSTWTAGTVTATAIFSAHPSMVQSVGAALGSSTAIIGATPNARVWQDDTSTPLAANGVFTGTSRDLTGVTANSVSAAGSAMGSLEARFEAISDVAGTLCLEVSRDNATWRRIRSVAMSNTGTDVVGAGGAIYEAGIEFKPKTRYARAVYINGGTLQTHFTVQTMLLA